MQCSNQLPEFAYYIYTNQSFTTRVCEFRCYFGAWYDASGPSCIECVPVQCPTGFYSGECTPTQPPSCVPCANSESCPYPGQFRDLCVFPEEANSECQSCTNAPPYAVYTNGCEWECPFSYINILDTCVFLPEDSNQLAVILQVYISNVYPANELGPGEVEFQPFAYQDSFTRFITGVPATNMFIIRAKKINATIIPFNVPPQGDELVRTRRRQLLQTGGNDEILGIIPEGSDLFTQVDSYFWYPIKGNTDPVQEIIDAVYAGFIQAFLKQYHGIQVGIAFVTNPSYLTRDETLDYLEVQGVTPQGTGVEDRFPDPNAPTEDENVQVNWRIPYIWVILCSIVITGVVANL